MDVSLVICTRDRPHALRRCLAAIGDINSNLHWELIVVDNASRTSETQAVVAAFATRAPMPVTMVTEPQPGLGRGRNVGVKHATGQYLAFTDDDCYPSIDFINAVYGAFETDPSLGYLSGRIMLHAPTDLPLTINESLTPRYYPPRSYVQSGDVQGANMAFRREALAAIGGFDPLFGSGALFSAEDIDAAGRASAAGWSGAYVPSAVVYHHHGRKHTTDLAAQWKVYAMGRGAYDMKMLLRGHLLWYARAIYGLRNRRQLMRTMPLWEQIGAARYLASRLRRPRREDKGRP